VRWGTAGRIGLGWLMTLPASAIVGAITAFIGLLGPVGVIIDLVIAVGVIVLIFVISKRSNIDARNALEGVSEVAESGRVVKIRKVKPKNARRNAA
jgi:PiT family inorganic phosphate transporter